MDEVVWRWWVIENQAGAGVGEAPWWRTSVSRVRSFWILCMIAGSRGADGCEFDLEVDLECSPRVGRLDMIDMMGFEERETKAATETETSTGSCNVPSCV